ncbi:MAG: hypothetical protein WC733_00120 [Methylophilus sp.]|jgi:hypothetical protein
MATIKTANASGRKPAPIPVAQEVVSIYEEKALLVGEVVNGNIVQLAILPAGCVPVGYVLGSTDVDTNGTPTATLDFGILDSAGTAISIATADGGDEWIDGSTLPQAGGIALHTASKALYDVLKDVQVSDEDRIVAVKFATAVATAAAGTVSLELSYRAAR